MFIASGHPRWVHRALSALVALTGFAALAAAQAPARMPPGDAVVTGRVIDRDSGTGIGGAIVTLRQLDGGGVLVDHTDSTGRYRFEQIVSGRHRLSSEAQGYAPADITVEVPIQQESIVSLSRAATIRGRVIGFDGKPVPDARVQAIERVGESGFRMTDRLGGQSNAQGEYELVVPAGVFEISATWVDREFPSKSLRIYYPGTSVAEERVAVTVKAGEIRSRVDIVTPAHERVLLRGRITAGDTTRVEASLLSATAVHAITVRGDGTFTAPRVPRGQYTLIARARVNEQSEAASVVVDLSDEALDVSLTLLPTTTLSGRVVTDDGSPFPRSIQVAAVLSRGRRELDPYRRDRTEVADDGSFRIEGLFGLRLLRVVGVTEGWRVSKVLRGKTPVPEAELEMSADASDVVLVLTQQ